MDEKDIFLDVCYAKTNVDGEKLQCIIKTKTHPVIDDSELLRGSETNFAQKNESQQKYVKVHKNNRWYSIPNKIYVNKQT